MAHGLSVPYRHFCRLVSGCQVLSVSRSGCRYFLVLRTRGRTDAQTEGEPPHGTDESVRHGGFLCGLVVCFAGGWLLF